MLSCALSLGGLAGCEPGGSRADGSRPGGGAHARREERTRPPRREAAQVAQATTPPPPAPWPDFGPLLDAACATRLARAPALPAPVGDLLRALEAAQGDLPALSPTGVWEPGNSPAEVALDLVTALPSHGVTPSPRALGLRDRLEELRLDLLAGPSWTGTPATDRARAQQLVRAEHLTVALWLEVARQLDALRPHPPRLPVDPALRLTRALGTWRDARALARTLTPPIAQYELLRGALARYEELARAGGFVPIPELTDGARPGHANPALPALRRRLAQEEPPDSPGRAALLAGSEGDPRVWDAALTDALRRARKAYVLDAPKRRRRGRHHRARGDAALLDRALLRALAVPAQDRVRQLRGALRAWRRSGFADHPYGVLVNIPDFHGEVWDGPRRLLRFRVVVGKPSRWGRMKNATPRLDAYIQQVIYNPYWNVPDRILRRELLRKAQRKLDAAGPDDVRTPLEVLQDDGYEIVNPDNPKRLWVRKPPGPGNALGRVKFLFENRWFVFLHDTNDRRKFRSRRRAFSHGCVRVEEPLRLAEILLRRDGSWDRVERTRALYRRKEIPIVLRTPVPISLTYVLARVTNEGRVRWLPDLYRLAPGARP